MMSEDNKVCKIDNPLLSKYTKRSRGGSTQIFHTGSDYRDFDRYRKEGRTLGTHIEMHDKPDTLRIEPPEKHYHSELVEGEWWWINGCPECTGMPRSSITYVECDKHNVCQCCRCTRESLDSHTYGGNSGWFCKSCHEIEREQEKANALASMPEEFDDYDYHDLPEIKCPYCGLEWSDSWESSTADNEEKTCDRCENTFTVTAVQTLTFNCDRIEAQELS